MAEPTVGPLSEHDVRRIAGALQEWAYSHPYPNDPLLAFASSRTLSPVEIANEVEDRTSDGELILRVFRFGLEVKSLDQIIIGLRSESSMGA